jgi:hypothetical protein
MTSGACRACYSPRLPFLILLCLASVACTSGTATPSGSTFSSSPPSSPLKTNDGTIGLPPTSDGVIAGDTVIQLAWQANSDSVAGYVVYYGPTPDSATTTASNLSLTSPSFDAAAPAVSFNAGNDLSLKHGDSVCFRLRAYNAAAVLSAWSNAACSVI